MTSQKKRTTSS